MHSRLIFRPQIERTETESIQTCYDKAAKGYGPSAYVEGLPRKASIICPYRKPTQVSEMSILRRVG